MTWKIFVSAGLLCGMASSAIALPTMTIVPGGIQSNNFVWEVDITPDFVLAGGGTPLYLELGFRLTGAPLVGATNINPSIFDTATPSNVIFGWETLTGAPPFPEGIQVNTATGEIFASFGSIDIPTPGPRPFLQIVALGPGNGGPSSSSIQWLGAFHGNGRISQIVGTTAQSFEIPSGSQTQVVPEPICGVLLALGVSFAVLGSRGRRRAT